MDHVLSTTSCGKVKQVTLISFSPEAGKVPAETGQFLPALAAWEMIKQRRFLLMPVVWPRSHVQRPLCFLTI